jgi:hypothetical protein
MDKDRRGETGDRPGRETSSLSSSSKEMVIRSILEPTSTLVDVLSPSGQTIRVSVEGFQPSATSNVDPPLVKGAADPAVSAYDFGQTPLTIPDPPFPQIGTYSVVL